ncbi:UNVERIFIED_ORG: hypothetical protein L601_004000000020 [Gordonia westfalica J30]
MKTPAGGDEIVEPLETREERQVMERRNTYDDVEHLTAEDRRLEDIALYDSRIRHSRKTFSRSAH